MPLGISLARRRLRKVFAGLCHVWEPALDKEDVAVTVLIEGTFLLAD